MTTKVLIIGSEGATGRAIVDVFDKSDEFTVFRMGRTTPKSPSPTLDRFIHLDLNDIESCESIASEYTFDIVIYLACIWRGRNVEMSNLMDNFVPFNNFINTIAHSAEHIVYFSSSLVYQGDNFDEVLPAELPQSTYGTSKLLSEHFLIEFCNKRAKKYTIFRPFHIVSPYEKYNPGSSHVVTDFIYKVRQGIEPNGDSFDKIWTPFTWAEDIGVATLRAVNSPQSHNQIFNIGASKTYSLLQLKQLIQACFSHEKQHAITSVNSQFGDELKHFDKSYELLGDYNITTFSSMVEGCVALEEDEK